MAKPILSTPALNEKQYFQIVDEIIAYEEAKLPKEVLVLSERAKQMMTIGTTEELIELLKKNSAK